MSATTLKDQVIMIGGGAKNLGGAIARHYAAGGARAIVVHYNSDATKVAAEIQYLVTEGWWITGQTILANGGYTTK